MAYRVDNIPIWWRPFWLAYSWVFGMAFWCAWNLLIRTCRFRFEGEQHCGGCENHIYSLWHDSWFLYFAAFARSHRRHIWLQHPDAYMKPVHIALRLAGIQVLLGSGGEEGREAARELVACLRRGSSTAISPDGPRGPCRVLKKGVLYLSLDSGVPILPLQLSVNRAIHIGWDRKAIPFPWSRITVSYGPPIAVTERDFEQAGRELAASMSGPDGQGVDSHRARGGSTRRARKASPRDSEGSRS